MTESNKKLSEHSFSPEEKYLLKVRIFKSLNQYRRRRFLAKVSIAASVVFVLGFISKLVIFSDCEVDAYSKMVDAVEVDSVSEVSLVLQERTIAVEEDNQVISYSKQSNTIKIGSDKRVEKDVAVVMNTLVVPFGKRSQLQLSDGTRIWINSGSKLIYPSEFKGETRTVFLEGEAAFDVAHDKNHPFKVLAKGQEIEVLGTVFNVSSYAEEPNVNTALKSGKIKISYNTSGIIKHSESVTLLPGHVASYNRENKSIKTVTADVSKYFLWKDGLIVFKNDKLGYILNRLSKYYNVDIVIEDEGLKEQSFSGYLDLKDSVFQVLELIKQSSEFDYNNDYGKQIKVYNAKKELPMK